MSELSEADLDHLRSWELAIACLRVELQSGRKLSPKEMIDLVDMAMPSQEAQARALGLRPEPQERLGHSASVAIARGAD